MSARTQADPTAALCTYLASTSVAGLLVDGAASIFRPKLPPEANLPQPMPFACMVVRPAGGYARFGGGLLPIGDPRLEIVCYGSAELEAQDVARETVGALRALRQQAWVETSAQGSPRVRLINARIEAGPLPLVDPDTSWPYCVVVAQVVHSEPSLP